MDMIPALKLFPRTEWSGGSLNVRGTSALKAIDLGAVHQAPEAYRPVLERNCRLSEMVLVLRHPETEAHAALAVDDNSFRVTTGGMQFRFLGEGGIHDVRVLDTFTAHAARCGSWKCWLSGLAMSGGKLVVAAPKEFYQLPDTDIRKLNFFEWLGSRLASSPFYARFDMGLTPRLLEAYQSGGGKLNTYANGQGVGTRTAASVVAGLLAALESTGKAVSGAHVVITGANGRIGKEMVRLFAEAGAKLSLSDLPQVMAKPDFASLTSRYQASALELPQAMAASCDILCLGGPPGDLTAEKVDAVRASVVGGPANDFMASPSLYRRREDVLFVPGAALTAASMTHPLARSLSSLPDLMSESEEIIKALIALHADSEKRLSMFQAMVVVADSARTKVLNSAAAHVSALNEELTAALTAVHIETAPQLPQGLEVAQAEIDGAAATEPSPAIEIYSGGARVTEGGQVRYHDPALKSFRHFDGPIAILGGSYDPVHNGHIKAARAALECEALGLRAVVFMPTVGHPHKDSGPHASSLHRYEMLLLALQDHPRMFVSRWELDRGEFTPAADTLEYIRSELPEQHKLYYLMGSDVWARLSRWKHLDRLLTTAEPITIARNANREADLEILEQLDVETRTRFAQGRIEVAPFPESSTAVRESLRAGVLDPEMIPDPVQAYIRRHQLYKLMFDSK